MNRAASRLACGALIAVGVFLGARAKSEPKPGLWWESTTSSNGAHVSRLRDSSNGVVCYVAVNILSETKSPAISCVKS